MCDRPYVICHMVSSVDGKIDGNWFGAPEVRTPLAGSNEIRSRYACRAVLYGAATMAQTYAEGWVDGLPEAPQSFPRQDWIAPSEVDRYYIAGDPNGGIAYDGMNRCYLALGEKAGNAFADGAKLK